MKDGADVAPFFRFFSFLEDVSETQDLVYTGSITRGIHVERGSVDPILLVSTLAKLTLVLDQHFRAKEEHCAFLAIAKVSSERDTRKAYVVFLDIRYDLLVGRLGT